MSDNLEQRVSRINVLFQQWRTYHDLLPIFDHQPKIASFNLTADLSGVTDAPTLRVPVEISAEGIEYPPQMVMGIKAQVEQRLKQISDELQQLGIKPE